MSGAHLAVEPGSVVLDGGPAVAPRLSLEEVVRPHDVADRGITFWDGATHDRRSYRELAGLAGAVAARLGAWGVRPGDRVAATIDNSLESVLTVLGIWSAGATVVSVPVAARRRAELHAAHFGALLAAAECAFLITDADADISGLRTIPAASLRGLGSYRGHRDVRIGRTALIQFTSGSVSEPKGVAIGPEKLAGHLSMMADRLEVDPAVDRYVSWLPLYHDMGLITMLLAALASRTDLVLMPSSVFALRPSLWLRTIATERGTITAAPNFAYRMAAGVPYEEGTDLSCVRATLCGAERLVWQTLVDFHTATEPLGLSWGALMPCYGLAEGVVGTTATRLGAGPVLGPGGHVGVGEPLPGVRLRATAGQPAGPLEMRGAWVMDGYHSSSGFTPVPSDEWFDTGDSAFVQDGQLHVLGRRNEVVSSGGHNVYAEDLEAAILGAERDGVRACAAFRMGEALERFGLMIEVAPAQAHDDLEALATRARATVNDAVGVRVGTVLVVRSGTIPRTTSGKVQRAECRAMVSAGPDSLGRRLLATTH
jgi:fatty-acyl-CoA synthase